MKDGICIAGNILVDKINEIDKFPKSGELTQINNISLATGGCVPNVGIDLKIIDKDLPVYASGRIGKDGEGDFVLSAFSKYGLDTQNVVIDNNDKTSFTDVMSITNGERTFFTYAGASAKFGDSDINYDNLPKMLHLGYFLLLKKIDEGDGEIILKKAKEKGMSTSIDLVSENSDRYKPVLPCLKYVDNLIINEIEASNLTGIEPTNENLIKICEKLVSYGVKERVIIHKPDIGVCYYNGEYVELPSYELPKGYIKGSTGAGDAFCAGALYGIYKGFSSKKILEFSSMCAVCSLSQAGPVSGMREYNEILKIDNLYRRKQK